MWEGDGFMMVSMSSAAANFNNFYLVRPAALQEHSKNLRLIVLKSVLGGGNKNNSK